MVSVKKVVAKWSSEDKATRGGDMHKFSLVNKLISMLFAHFNAFLTLFQKSILCPKIHKEVSFLGEFISKNLNLGTKNH